MKKILCAILALVMLCMSLPVQAKAVTRHDLTYREVTRNFDIWEDGTNIYVKYGEKQCALSIEKYKYYAVYISEYEDTETGDYVTQIVVHRSTYKYFCIDKSEIITDEVKGAYYNALMGIGKGDSMHVDAIIINADGLSDVISLHGEGAYSFDWSGASDERARVYVTPLEKGLYKTYSNINIYSEKSDSGEIVFVSNPLPGTPSNTEESDICKTVFRMLTEGALTYNTYYYKSVYQSAADEISCNGNNGKVRVDSTLLADGTVTRTLQSSGYLMCQISSYGTAYDIVETNDQNLCALLGISMPDKKYWDVASQQWKTESSSGGSSSGGSSGGNGSSNIDQSQLQEDTASVAPITNLSVKFVGEDALIDPVLYNDYFANQVFHENKLTDLNTKVWGLGAYLSWSYNGIKYETDSSVDSGDSGALLTQTINQRRIKLVVKAKFRIDSSTTKTLVYILYDFDNNKGIAVGAGSRRISFYDLCLFFQNAYPEYITDFPTQLVQIAYYLTPYYQDHETGKYVYGSTSHIAQNVASELADYSGGDWEGDNGGWSNENNNPFDQINNDLINWADDISNDISDFGSVVGIVTNIVPTIKGLFSSLGQFPAMLAAFFPFIPAAFWEIICVGIVITGTGFVIKAFLSFLGAL